MTKKSSADPDGPSKKDLHKVLDSILHRNSSKKKKLKRAMDAAQRAYDKFKETNPTIKKLIKAKDAARDAYYQLQNEEREEKQLKVARLRETLYLVGSTPALRNAIAELVKEYSEEEGNDW